MIPPPTAHRSASLRTRLRAATHSRHVILNQHPLLQNVTSAEFPLDNYIKILHAYAGLYQALEQSIDDFLAEHSLDFSYRERRKLPWLLADLAFLENRGAALPTPPSLPLPVPGITGAGQLSGVLYVIEGSTLGGQLISKALERHHGLTLDRGARFFNGYGERTLPLWDEFLNFLENILEQGTELELAEINAIQTFDLFLNTLHCYT